MPVSYTHLDVYKRQGYDSGDHLHPSGAGYKAMADAVPKSFLY